LKRERVKNEIDRGGAPEPATRNQRQKVDDLITAQVKAALYNHRSTALVKTKLITNGEVTLTYCQKTRSEKSLVSSLSMTSRE